MISQSRAPSSSLPLHPTSAVHPLLSVVTTIERASEAPSLQPHLRDVHDLYRFKTNRTASGLGFHKISYAAWWYSFDHAAKHLPPLNRQVPRNAGLVVSVGWPLLAGLVRAVPVVVAGVLARG
jgi:hypothetical protein